MFNVALPDALSSAGSSHALATVISSGLRVLVMVTAAVPFIQTEPLRAGELVLVTSEPVGELLLL